MGRFARTLSREECGTKSARAGFLTFGLRIFRRKPRGASRNKFGAVPLFRAALPGGLAKSKTRQWGLRVSSAGRLQWRDRGRFSRPSLYPENRPVDDSKDFPAS